MLSRARDLLRTAYDRQVPPDETVWHRWFVFWPVRATNGRWVSAQVWRRQIAGRGWEYQRRDEPSDDMHVW